MLFDFQILNPSNFGFICFLGWLSVLFGFFSLVFTPGCFVQISFFLFSSDLYNSAAEKRRLPSQKIHFVRPVFSLALKKILDRHFCDFFLNLSGYSVPYILYAFWNTDRIFQVLFLLFFIPSIYFTFFLAAQFYMWEELFLGNCITQEIFQW